MDVLTIIADLAREAERQVRDHAWRLTSAERDLAQQTEAGLRAAVGPREAQEALPEIERLEHLRETLAVLAVSLARIHGRMAWFLSGALTALEPVLQWRAFPTDGAPPSAPVHRLRSSTPRPKMPSVASRKPWPVSLRLRRQRRIRAPNSGTDHSAARTRP
ncbi:hypothetical protein ACFQZC_37510 [Streptacidiphilus monticola]